MKDRLKKYIKIFTPLAKIEKPERSDAEKEASRAQSEEAKGKHRKAMRAFFWWQRHTEDMTPGQIANAYNRRHAVPISNTKEVRTNG